MYINKSNNNLEQILSLYGKEFDYNRLQGELKELYLIPVEYATAALSPAFHIKDGIIKSYPFCVKYIVNHNFNAFTFNMEEGSLVCIHCSVPILLYQLCLEFACCCNTKDSIPYKESVKQLRGLNLKLKYALSPHDAFVNGITSYFNNLIKSDIYQLTEKENRKAYALYLYDLAIRFFIMHECMHIILGHTAYSQKRIGLNELFEFSTQREDKMDINFSQTIEFISDCHAARGVLVQSLLGELFCDYPKHFSSTIMVDKDCYVFRATVNALCLLFHLFPSKLKNGIADCLIKSHPHPYMRMQWLITELSAELEDSKQFHDYLHHPFACSLLTMHELYGLGNSWIELMQEDSPNQQNDLYSYFNYKNITEKAKLLQHDLWLLSPLYEGDIRE